jgi:hypothetical protein
MPDGRLGMLLGLFALFFFITARHSLTARPDRLRASEANQRGGARAVRQDDRGLLRGR